MMNPRQHKYDRLLTTEGFSLCVLGWSFWLNVGKKGVVEEDVC